MTSIIIFPALLGFDKKELGVNIMDEMDLIQDATSAAQDAMIEARRKRAALEASIKPPSSRECSDCGVNIPAGRLKIKPMALRCVDCQEEMEGPVR